MLLIFQCLSFHLYWIFRVGLVVHGPCLSDGDSREDSCSDLLLTRYLTFNILLWELKGERVTIWLGVCVGVQNKHPK